MGQIKNQFTSCYLSCEKNKMNPTSISITELLKSNVYLTLASTHL